MGKIHITVSDRALERTIYIIIILVLGFFVVQDTFLEGDTQVDQPEPPTQNPAPSNTDNTTDNPDQADTSPVDNTTDDTTDQDSEQEPQDEQSGDQQDDQTTGSDTEDLSGEVDVSLGDIDFTPQSPSSQVNGITVNVDNGRSEDAKLFATISISETGNTDIESVNPFWDQVELPAVSSGDTKVVSLDPNSGSYAINVEDGDTVDVEATFTNLQGTVNVTDTNSQTVS